MKEGASSSCESYLLWGCRIRLYLRVATRDIRGSPFLKAHAKGPYDYPQALQGSAHVAFQYATDCRPQKPSAKP